MKRETDSYLKLSSKTTVFKQSVMVHTNVSFL